MENASKALLMAASVLVALIIIGVLVWMFTSISNTQQTEADSEETLRFFSVLKDCCCAI